MNATICPTVTTTTADAYKKKIELLARFAERVHLDSTDGIFAPTKLTPIPDLWWPKDSAIKMVDIHAMYQRPFEHAVKLFELKPHLIVVHAECEGDFAGFARAAQGHGIKVGLALLADTPVSQITSSLELVDHVLIFAGKLGYHGGQADLSLLDKAKELKQLKPELELGWDGGVSDQNARALMEGGIDVLNTGGFIDHADDPEATYRQLQQLIS